MIYFAVDAYEANRFCVYFELKYSKFSSSDCCGKNNLKRFLRCTIFIERNKRQQNKREYNTTTGETFYRYQNENEILYFIQIFLVLSLNTFFTFRFVYLLLFPHISSH